MHAYELAGFIRSGEIGLARDLIKAGESLDSVKNIDEFTYRNSAVLMLVDRNEMVDWVTSWHGGLEAKDEEGMKPIDILMAAISDTEDAEIEKDCMDRLDLLLANGAALDKSAAMHAYSYDHKMTIVQKMLSMGADINSQDSNGNTLLMKVQFADFDDIKTAHNLLDHGAMVTIRNDDGDSVLDIISSGFSALYGTDEFEELHERLLCCRDNELLTTDIAEARQEACCVAF